MKSTKALKNILVIHGPNLNMLGERETAIYGKTRLVDIITNMEKLGCQHGLAISSFQSNHEGAIVDAIQDAVGELAGLIINPAALTHTSIAIRDALLLLNVPIIEVHLSNIHRREAFRHTSLISDVATGQIIGLGVQGYYLALQAIAAMIFPSEM